MQSPPLVSSGGICTWAYLGAFAATAARYMGIHSSGRAAIGAAAVLASQGKLNIAAVLIVAAIGNQAGGLLGFQVGDRWAGRPRWALVSSAVWRKVPAGPVKVPSVSMSSSSAILFQVLPVVVSVIRISGSASQHKMVLALIRSSLRGRRAAGR